MLIEDKREQTRMAAQEPVQVRLPETKGFCATGRISDFSSIGLGVRLSASLPVGATVIVEHRGAYLIGKIIYAHADANEFRVGISLEILNATKGGIIQITEAAERDTSARSLKRRADR